MSDKLNYAVRQLERSIEAVRRSCILPVRNTKDLNSIREIFAANDDRLDRFVNIMPREALAEKISAALIPPHLSDLFETANRLQAAKKEALQLGDYQAAANFRRLSQDAEAEIIRAAGSLELVITPEILLRAVDAITGSASNT